ncbi:MAG: serine--tRNA ligase [Nanoarchaeota archaeon]
MIDIKLIRENQNLVKENIKKRFKDISVVDKIIKKDSEWRKFKGETDSLRAERNKLSKQVAELKKAGKDAAQTLKKAQEIPEKIDKIEAELKKLESEINELLLTIPNILHNKVPIGKDSTKNIEIKKWGKIVKPKFEIKNHAELIESMGKADFNAGRANAGEGFNYLLGDIALLDHALQRYGVDFLLKKGFTLVVPPMMLNFETLLASLNGLKDFEEVVYKIEKENLYMIGTAEHSLVSLYKNRVLNMKELPIKLCALTPCFRKEIGSHGVDTKGLYRMHQFNKVEQVVYCSPEESYKMLEEMQKISEEFFQSLKIPYRVIEICSGDLSQKLAKQYDIEAWFPRQGKYGEVTSAGNCTDFQSRALDIKYYNHEQKVYPHLLNNTMVATSRAMVAILENFQQKDGSVEIPKVLQPYMFNKKKIGTK